jgi:hypothetical protein
MGHEGSTNFHRGDLGKSTGKYGKKHDTSNDVHALDGLNKASGAQNQINIPCARFEGAGAQEEAVRTERQTCLHKSTTE